MYQQFLKSIAQFGDFSEADQKLLVDRLQEKNLKKGEVLLKQGDVSQSAFFVSKGCLRHFRDVDGYTEITLNLFLENDWVLDHSSFTGQNPSQNKIEAFENCELLELSMHVMHELIAMSPSFFKLGKILEPSGGMADLPLKTPEEKYINLMNKRPELIQRFPLKHIASLLGMTPETLSRVRAKTKF